MRISVQSSLPARKAEAEAIINERFNREAVTDLQKDMEYRRKKEIAESVLDGAEATAEFAEEAKLMGLSVVDLAAIIQAKPDTVMDRAIRRRRAILVVRSTATVDDLNRLLSTGT